MSVAIHPLIETTLRERHVRTEDGAFLALSSEIMRDSCALIYEAAIVTHATRAVETGMAFGISTVCLADAMTRNSQQAHLISIDPSQTSDWRSVGLAQLVRAGLRDHVTLMETPSHVALPQLCSAGERVDLAFIDGWHTFDHALVDFFYIDLLMRVGGIVIFDDLGYPAINTLARFVSSNRNYEIFEILQSYRPARRLRIRRAIKSSLRRIARTDHDPGRAELMTFRRFKDAHTVAFRKTGDDDRRFDHFRPF